MSNEIFDRETQLDLLVNIIPLFILGFFVVGFLVFAPFGIDPLASSIQFGLIAIPFVLLTVLTYFAAVAVAGSERSDPVYLPGQASVRGAEPLKIPGAEDDTAVSDDTAAAAELDGDVGEPEAPSDGAGGADATDADATDADADADAADATDAE
jgi:hypothetical protein